MFALRAASPSTSARAMVASGWLLLLGALAAAFSAQSQVGAGAEERALTPSAAATQAAPAAYRSAMEGYQPYTEEKTVNWKEANDTTGRIGGWREYAKEASQPESGAKPQAPDAAAKPAARPVPAKP